jgi:hypothetical protein
VTPKAHGPELSTAPTPPAAFPMPYPRPTATKGRANQDGLPLALSSGSRANAYCSVLFCSVLSCLFCCVLFCPVLFCCARQAFACPVPPIPYAQQAMQRRSHCDLSAAGNRTGNRTGGGTGDARMKTWLLVMQTVRPLRASRCNTSSR